MRALLACVLLVVAGCLLGAPLAGAAAPAHGPLTVGQAHHAYLAAQRTADEAKRVYVATRAYSARYGGAVGRWCRTARVAGWGWGALPTLMGVTYYESRGDPTVVNSLGCTGLLQIYASVWHCAIAWLMVPLNNLREGLHIWKGEGRRFLPAWAGDPAVP